MLSMGRAAKVSVMVLADIFLLPFCFMIATVLRSGNSDTSATSELPLYLSVAAITVIVFGFAGLYSAIVRFIDQRLLSTTGLGLAIVVASTSFLSSLYGYPDISHNTLIIYWFIAFSYVVVSRLIARAFLRKVDARTPLNERIHVAIYGAGEAGAKLALATRASDQYRPVCFFDDRKVLDGRSVAGLKVYCSDRLVSVATQRRIDVIAIAMPSASPEQRKEVMVRASKSGIPVKTICSVMEMADEEISVQSIREIKLEDLLGREPIRPHPELFAKCVSGQTLLVTGAGGSIGSELCRQIMTLAPRQIHLLDHSEYALYSIKRELTERFPHIPVHAHLGSVCDATLVDRVMQGTRIDTVYHAAAYKHVTLVEDNMAEGVRNNILGAEVISAAAGRYGVKTCVLISSDKAVRPTSMMGASKRVAELIFQAAALRFSENTKYCMVRFGNVLGSSGSVVPLFTKQIELGGPITITHPDVVRYFMSIPEAAQLVMQAGAMATGGDVFVMDMGEPVKIVDLARTMIAMCGLSEKSSDNADGDIGINFIGLRPGEKLYEELFAGNDAIPSRHPRIMTTTEYVIAPEVLAQQVAYLMVACSTNDKDMIRFIVQKLVRGYVPDMSSEKFLDDEKSEVQPVKVHANYSNVQLGEALRSGT